jgi:hypothetical protein
MKRKHLPVISLIFIFHFWAANAGSGKILITEFMAVNSNNIVDEDGEHSDWIEIHNPTDEDINLTGWHITDDATKPDKWTFPAVTIRKDAYLVIFASDKNRTDPAKNMHTNFKLSGSGEYLAVTEPDLTVSHAYDPLFPAQQQDVSYGLFQGQYVFFASPSPGSANIYGALPFEPVFSKTRGFYTDPLDVTITIPGGEGQIYYSTNGTRPNKTDGILYTGSVRITTTTSLSAVTINNAGASSSVVSHTYIYLKDVIAQPANPAGYPTSWKAEKDATELTSDYQMDTRVTSATAYKDLMIPALKALPTMNIVTNTGYLFSNKEDATTGGIYIYTGLPHTESKAWARPASVEYFDPATGKEFQVNCRLKLHGGNSRRPTNSPKHGFELAFKSDYGPSKLNFDIFDEKKTVKEFNSLVLRAGYNYTWVKNAAAQQSMAQYIQDSWAKTTQLEMGHPAAHETFVHLYLNGLYWGLYNISEELDKDFMESYLGGNEDDYDVIKEKETTTPTDGNMTAWNTFKSLITGVSSNETYQKIQGKNANGSVNSAYPNLLDVDNYIDYMLINYYIGNGDWDANNWTVGRNRVKNESGFKFFCWDAETAMTSLTDNKIITGTAGNPTAFMQYLKKNSDFKVRMADHIQKQLIDAGGALTPATVTERYNKLADEIELGIIGESARWSDWYAPYNPYTRNDHWILRKNDLINNYFPYRTEVLLGQLKAAGLFPTTVTTPLLSHPSGSYSQSFNLSITATAGTVYYTTDETDPRTEITDVISAKAKSYTGLINIGSTLTVKARAKSGTEWSAIAEGIYNFDALSGIDMPLAEQMQLSGFPNPFSQSVRIRFNAPATGNVNIVVTGIDGHVVEQLFDGIAYAGFNEIQWNPTQPASGIYICRITYNGQQTFLKLVRK